MSTMVGTRMQCTLPPGPRSKGVGDTTFFASASLVFDAELRAA